MHRRIYGYMFQNLGIKRLTNAFLWITVTQEIRYLRLKSGFLINANTTILQWSSQK